MTINNIEVIDRGIIVKPGTKVARRYYEFNCSDCNAIMLIPKSDIMKRTTKSCNACNNKSIMEKRATEAAVNFERRARHTHGDKYSYEKVEYKNNKTKVIIHCNKHDWDFMQTPYRHIKGDGCKKCSNNHTPTNEEYDEKLVLAGVTEITRVGAYTTALKPVLHRHECGHEWEVSPHNILQGHGCPVCMKGTDGDILYVWRVTNTNIYKIGITSERLGDKRIISVVQAAGVEAYSVEIYEKISNAKDIERFIHDKFKMRPKNLRQVNGYTEFRILKESDIQIIKEYIKGKQNEN